MSLSSSLFCDIATLLVSFHFRASISLFSAFLFDMASLLISLCFEQSASACFTHFCFTATSGSTAFHFLNT